MTILEISDLSVNASGQKILDSISCKIHRGEYVSIIGPNGAGKTTLLKCILRIMDQMKGCIQVLGKDISHYRQKKLAQWIAYVPQATYMNLPFTVKEFVEMGRYAHHNFFSSQTKEDRVALEKAFEWTEITHLKKRYMNRLSGGERQSVFIASALAQEAKILLLDECTSHLDPSHENQVLEMIDKVNREMNMTILSVTHNINSAALHSHRILMLKCGKIIFDGEPERAMSNQVLEDVYDTSFQFIQHPDAKIEIILPRVFST